VVPKHNQLPTITTESFRVTDFLDSFISELRTDTSCTNLSMFFYAVTKSGWDCVRKPMLDWKRQLDNRSILLCVGTDHAITDPYALSEMLSEGIEVRLMKKYNGVFHPKVVWLYGRRRHVTWVGSNNLTRDGLKNNVEFALRVTTEKKPSQLDNWVNSVLQGSVQLTSNLINSYETQRKKFEKARRQAGLTTFTWVEKSQPVSQKVETGRLIVEVMPRETGGDGRQLQLPVRAAHAFFGLNDKGSSKTIKLRALGASSFIKYTISVFSNHTVRIVVRDLDYRDRPCVLIFQKQRKSYFEYEIVSENIFPDRYKQLLRICNEQTRSGSRRWGMT